MAGDATHKNISTKQRRAIAALLETGDIAKAAQAAGVARSTVYRWRTEEGFLAALREAEMDAMRALMSGFVSLGEMVVQALRDALDPSQDLRHRLRAADIFTQRIVALREMLEFEERLVKLESYIEGDKTE